MLLTARVARASESRSNTCRFRRGGGCDAGWPRMTSDDVLAVKLTARLNTSSNAKQPSVAILAPSLA